jgi:hypothetical protein
MCLAKDCKISVVGSEDYPHASAPIMWESVALSGIFFALREKSGLKISDYKNIDIKILSIVGNLQEFENTGVAIAASVAVSKAFGQIEFSNSELQGWKLE